MKVIIFKDWNKKKIEDEKAHQELLAAEAKAKSQQSRDVLPKGFEAKSKVESPKTSKGTLPKGF